MTNYIKNKAEDSTPIEPPKALEPKKRKTEKHNMGKEQKASPNVTIPKRMRPSAPELQSSKTESHTGEKEREEGKLGLLLDKARLQRQLSQLREEMSMNQSWIENVMQESRMKDEKIMQLEIKILEAAMVFEEQKSSNDSVTLNVAEENPIIDQPSSLVQSATKPDLCQPNASVDLNFADSSNYP